MEWLYKLREPAGGTIDIHGLGNHTYSCWLDEDRLMPVDPRMGMTGNLFPTGVVGVSGDTAGFGIPTDTGNISGAWLGLAVITPANDHSLHGQRFRVGPYQVDIYDCGGVSDLARLAATKGENLT